MIFFLQNHKKKPFELQFNVLKTTIIIYGVGIFIINPCNEYFDILLSILYSHRSSE